MKHWALPSEVEAVFGSFLTCEFATVGKGGCPVALPILPTYWAERGQFVLASPVALAQKAANVRRNPRVSLLYSNPTGSGLVSPPAVLVQGDGQAPDQVVTGTTGLDPALLTALAADSRKMLRKQPGMRVYLANPLTRHIMEWYFLRVLIFVTPRRITWWDDGDLARPAHSLEGPNVSADRQIPARIS